MNSPRLLTFMACVIIACVNMSAVAQAPTGAREQLNAILWQQRAVEYRATALQVYRQAGARLASVKNNGLTASVEQQRAGGFRSKRPAVVLDIDETVLDNTPFNALLVREGRSFDPLDWGQWVMAARAAAVPGAREFIQRARAARFRVIFITNRECNRTGAYNAQGRSLDCPQKRATLDNLETALGFRPADADLLMRFEVQGRDDSDKQARRLEVARTHRIAMLIGDDLNDFIRRADYTPENHGNFWGAASGAAWYALPNAIYGSWERGFPDIAQKYAGLNVWDAPEPPPSARLQVVSWNLEWLADPAMLQSSGFWTQCAAQGFPNLKLRDDLPFCDVYKRDGILTPEDYEQKKLVPMRTRLAELAAQSTDVFAVQEVGSAAALNVVLPPGFKVACFTVRVDAQNVGFAIRETSDFEFQCKEIVSLSQESNPAVERPVRRGLELKVSRPRGIVLPRSLTLLNVHLKSSCPTGRMDVTTNSNCATLQQQAPALEAWIEEQAAQNQPFAIIGDWNRDLDADPSSPLQPTTLRNLWPELNDLKPPNSAMEVAAVDRNLSRITPTCHDILDQLAISSSLKAQLAPTSLTNGRVPAKLLDRPAAASDHCPLRVEFLYR
jgi:5'-nucleotidase (lipoprotein e(P4) family)